jgi:hypothetical protein
MTVLSLYRIALKEALGNALENTLGDVLKDTLEENHKQYTLEENYD